ncbi:MAG: ABC transporter permease subunit [Tumebacillaceae bacterium]
MNLFPLHKGLLWKEWRQNRGVFWLALVILCAPVIGSTLMHMFDMYMHPMPAQIQEMEWKLTTDVAYRILLGQNVFFTYMAVAAIGLGGILLAQERTLVNTLDFLASTPVSRREILNAKYVTGLKMIGIVLGVNLVFAVVMALMFSSGYPIWWTVRFFLEQAVFLAAMLSAGLFLATICGNLVSTALAAVALNIGPYVVGNFLMDVMQRFVLHDYTAGNGVLYRTFTKVENAFSLIHYVRLTAADITSLQVFGMLIATIGFYLLSVLVFEKNAFERNRRMLMFGDFWKIAQVVVPFGIAVIVAIENGGLSAWDRKIIPFLLTFILLYVGLKLVRRLIRSFGFK